MAGIGFILRRLAKQDNYLGVIRAYFYSLVAVVGPWILVVVSLSVLFFLTSEFVTLTELGDFLSVIIYNLLFTFILSAPLYMIASRYVADCLFKRNAYPIVGIFVLGEWYQAIPALVIATFFYIFFTAMTPFMTLISIINFMVFNEIWFVMLFLTCIRNYRAITISWVIGVLLAIVLGTLWSVHRSSGMLFGFTIGITVLLFSLKANILAEYPYRYVRPKEFRFYFRHYKGLFWTGFFLFAGLWVDKVIMWGTPQATIHPNNLRTFPLYDGAMFYSYLSIVPIMALFVFSLETNFFDSYYSYLRNIETNAPFSSLEKARQSMISKLIENGRSFLILQGSLTVVIILLAPTIFDWLDLNFLQLGIFRLGTLGAFFSAFNFLIVILFSYFDSQENMMYVTMLMFFSNTIFTFITLELGFAYYGYGFAASMILTFAVGSILFIRFITNLHYNIFISNVVKRFKAREGFKEIEFSERGMK